MAVIDVDAHVVETEHSWVFMTGEDSAYAPRYLQDPRSNQRVLVVDGKVMPETETEVMTADRAKQRGIPEERRIAVGKGAAAMENVAVRISDMDEFGVDVQVLQPTMFLRPYSDDSRVQVAMCKSYARWMIELTKDYRNRLKWAVPLPLLSIKDSLDLLNFAHDNGAVSVFMRPFEGDKPIYDPYFDPIYQEASRLNMPIGVHVGNGNSNMTDVLMKHVGFGGGFLGYVQPVMSSFHGVVTSGLPKRFPNLRIGFLEASAQWLPWVMSELRRREGWKQLPSKLMEDYRLYVACFTSDDLDYIINDPAVGPDNIVLGTDYGHVDVATEVEAMKNLSGDTRLPVGTSSKILEGNPSRFYAI